MKIIFNYWSAAALVAAITPFGLATFADEPIATASDAEILLTVLQRDDDGPRRGPEARPRGPEDRRPDGDRPPPGARGRGPADRGPADRGPGDRGPGDRGPGDRADRPRVGPPGGPPPGARRGGPGPQSLDGRIARLEQKLDTVLREIRSLRNDRPPLAMMAQRSPAGPPQFGMRGWRPATAHGPASLRPPRRRRRPRGSPTRHARNAWRVLVITMARARAGSARPTPRAAACAAAAHLVMTIAVMKIAPAAAVAAPVPNLAAPTATAIPT